MDRNHQGLFFIVKVLADIDILIGPEVEHDPCFGVITFVDADPDAFDQLAVGVDDVVDHLGGGCILKIKDHSGLFPLQSEYFRDIGAVQFENDSFFSVAGDSKLMSSITFWAAIACQLWKSRKTRAKVTAEIFLSIVPRLLLLVMGSMDKYDITLQIFIDI